VFENVNGNANKYRKSANKSETKKWDEKVVELGNVKVLLQYGNGDSEHIQNHKTNQNLTHGMKEQQNLNC
jgi:hypothetical protein